MAERSLRPFTLTGEPIEGGPESDPTPVTVGDFIDTLGPVDSKEGVLNYVFTRTTAGTTLRASAITQGPPGDQGLLVEIYDANGDRCSYGQAIRQLGGSREIVGVEATAAAENECDGAGDYRIRVEHGLSATRVPFGLRVSDEPPVEDVGFSSPSGQDPAAPEIRDPEVSGRPTPAVGGSGFATATQIGDGRWSSTVVPGEALLFKIPLDFGQSARVSVRFPRATGALAEATGLFPPLANMRLFNPMQAQLSNPPGAELSGSVGDDQDQVFRTATPAVSRELVDAQGAFNGTSDYSTAGDYYLSMSLDKADYSLEFPFTIDVEVIGEAQDGPTYADDVSWSVAGGLDGELSNAAATNEPESGTPQPEESEAPPAAGDENASSDTSSSAVRIVGVGIGLVGLLAVATALVLWRRMRLQRR